MKFAYLILAHNNFIQLVRLVHQLNCEQVSIFIHIDEKCEIDADHLKGGLSDCNNVFILDNKKNITRKDFGIAETTVKLISTCLQQDYYEYISIISGQDLPLVSNNDITNYLEKNKGSEFLKHMELPAENNWYDNEGLERHEYYSAIDELGLNACGQMADAQKIENHKRSFSGGLKLYRGSGWFTITHSCARYVIEFFSKRTELVSFFRYTYASEEILFPTIIMNSPFKENVVNNNLRYIDWKSGHQYPKILMRENVDIVINSGKLWTGKFDTKIDGTVLDQLEKSIINSANSVDKSNLISANRPVVNLVLLYCGLRTAHFGQGSFIGNLIPAFGDGYKLLIIKTDAIDAKEVVMEYGEKADTLTIPQPENKLYLTGGDTPIQRKYAQRIVDIMLPYVQNRPNLIFWANSIDYLNVCKYIRENFEGPKIMYVHHSWSWKYIINVSDEEFAKQWRKKNVNYHEKAFKYTGYQQQLAAIADLVIAVTNQAAEFMTNVLDISSHKVKMIYNGIDRPLLQPMTKQELKKKYGFSPEEKVILFTGRVTEDKGVGYLIEAFKLVIQKYANVRLLIIGAGNLHDFIPMTAPFWSRVTFTDELESELVSEFYQLADIGVLPSLHEQCSFTAIEMRFHRLPIIVTSIDGLDEVFEDRVDTLKLEAKYDKNGVRTLSSEELAEKLIILLENESLCNTLTENSYQKAEQLFTAKRMREKYLEAMNFLHQSSKDTELLPP